MLALCLMLSVTYYAQNYAGIINWFLTLSFGDAWRNPLRLYVPIVLELTMDEALFGTMVTTL